MINADLQDCVAANEQCGGNGYTGPTCCPSDYTCFPVRSRLFEPPWGEGECVEFTPGDSSGVLCAQLSFQSIKGFDKLIADHDSGFAMQVNAFYSGCKKDTVVLLMTSGSQGSMN